MLVFLHLPNLKTGSPFFFLRLIIFIGASRLGMNSVKDLSGKAPKNPRRSPDDICVLLLDSDPTCLTIISKMLQKSGYRVVTAERAADALHILREKDGEIDLVMAEAHLSDMGKYELLETITGISKVPIVVMAEDGQPNSALGCLYKGAKHYLVKPLVMGDLTNLWQATISSRRGVRGQLKAGQPMQNGSGNDAKPPLHAEEHAKDTKRMELAETEEHKEASGDKREFGNQKKPNSICSDELQNGSIRGVRGLGNEDEVNQGNKRKERGGTEKPEEGDDYEFRIKKIPKFSCVDKMQNRSPQAIQGLGTDETKTLLPADELNLDNNKKKEGVEAETHEEDGENTELGIQKQPKMVCAYEMENRSPQNVGDVGCDGVPVSNLHEGALQSVERSMQPVGHQLSPVESSSNDHKWRQMRRAANVVESPQEEGEGNRGVEEVLKEETNSSQVSEIVLGNIRELAEFVRDEVDEEEEEEQGSPSDVLDKSPQH